jgi:hypothetical protein
LLHGLEEDARVSAKIEDLQTDVQEAARKLDNAIPFPHVVLSTYRFDTEQVALFLQGRVELWAVNLVRALAKMKPTADRWTVTECDGINTKSNHQSGRALDIVPLDEKGNPCWPPEDDMRWEIMGKLGELYGFRWGGRWKKPDRPHFEMP